MSNLFGITKKDLEEYFLGIGQKKFKATQVYEWIYQKRVFSIDLFSNIKKEVRDQLKQNFDTSLSKL